MIQTTRRLFLGGSAAMATGARGAHASDTGPIRIGVLGDQSGITADAGGPGTVTAVKMAVTDFGGKVGERPIEVISADMLMKPDVAAQIAARWYDIEGVDVIVDLPLSSAALAVLEVARTRKKSTLVTAAATVDFTGAKCSPTNVHWIDDTYALANVAARAVVAAGGKSWFFITADYTFGTTMQADAEAAVRAAGGTVVGSVRNPIGAGDFSSYLLAASSSGANVIGLASVGGDTITAIKQAAEFGIGKGGQRLAGFLVFITDIHALGLEVAQGLYVSSGFYWNQNDASRAFSQRFMQERHVMPTKSQAASYAATVHWLKAVEAAGTTDSVVVNRQMRMAPGDFFGKPTVIRQDGRAVYDMDLYRVKAPSETKIPWDYYKPISTVLGDDAFRSVTAGGCSM